MSQSFEDLSLADEQLTSMKGGVVPKNRTESMRSYKKSRGKGSAGSDRSDILQGDEDAISVVGSVISAPSERAASGEAGLAKEGIFNLPLFKNADSEVHIQWPRKLFLPKLFSIFFTFLRCCFRN